MWIALRSLRFPFDSGATLGLDKFRSPGLAMPGWKSLLWIAFRSLRFPFNLHGYLGGEGNAWWTAWWAKYRGTWLKTKHTLLGPYHRHMLRVL